MLLDLTDIAVRALPTELWGDGPFRRSDQLSPLYAQRYCGPRSGRITGRHPFWELSYVFRGEGVFHADRPFRLSSNSAILIPAGMEHTETAAEPMDTLWVGLHGSRLDLLDGRQIHAIQAASLAIPCEQLWLWSQYHRQRLGSELDALVAVIVSRFLRLVAETQPQEQAITDLAMQYVNDHLAEPIVIRQVAEHVGCSEGHLQRAFRSRTGRTLLQYLAQSRIQLAIEMMRQTSLPLSRIAHYCGYVDPLYFSRVFRSTMGVAPRLYRRSMLPADTATS